MSARARKHGFTLVEVLISVMLLSLLVTSVATAVRAALGSCKDNASSEQLNQTTRNLLLRITREMRTCDAIDQLAGTSHLTIYPATNAANTFHLERGQAHDARNHRMIDLDDTKVWLVIGLAGILRNRHAPDSCAFWEKVARRVRNSLAKYRPERGGREFFI